MAAPPEQLSRLKMEDFSAGALSVYNDKLIKSQQGIYGMFNMARQFIFSDPDDQNEFVKLYKGKAKSKEMEYVDAAGVLGWSKDAGDAGIVCTAVGGLKEPFAPSTGDP